MRWLRVCMGGSGCVWERKGVSAQGRKGVCARDGDGRIRRLGASDIALNSEAAE